MCSKIINLCRQLQPFQFLDLAMATNGNLSPAEKQQIFFQCQQMKWKCQRRLQYSHLPNLPPQELYWNLQSVIGTRP